MTEAERIGLLKIDFLGLRNLSIIHQIILQVKKDLNINIDIEAIPYDDKKFLIYYQTVHYRYISIGIRRC